MANRVSEVPDNTVSLVETQEYLKTVSILTYVAMFLYNKRKSYTHALYEEKNTNFLYELIDNGI